MAQRGPGRQGRAGPAAAGRTFLRVPVGALLLSDSRGGASSSGDSGACKFIWRRVVVWGLRGWGWHSGVAAQFGPGDWHDVAARRHGAMHAHLVHVFTVA